MSSSSSSSFSPSGRTWKASSLAHISGKDRRYSPITERTLNRRLKKFSIGAAAAQGAGHSRGEHDEGEANEFYGDERGDFARSPTATNTRSPTAASAVKNGFVEETSYDELEASRPIRLNAPTLMDVPPRAPLPRADDALMHRLFSPAAHRDAKRGVKSLSGPAQLAKLNDTTDGFAFKSKMADAQMLATASRRAGDGAGECLAFFRLALLQDNLGSYKHAISAYKKYLAACERTGDLVGVALALNCIGVNLQLMASTENDPERRERLLRNAAAYHDRHFEVGETRSQFVAKINGGLVRMEQGDHRAAVAAFGEALKYALILKAPREQSVAFGNLATASFAAEDHEKAEQFVHQQLEMLEEIPGAEEEAARARLVLCRVAAAKGEFQEAQEQSEAARKLAEAAGARALANVAKCYVGVSLARLMFDDVIHETAKEIAGGKSR